MPTRSSRPPTSLPLHVHAYMSVPERLERLATPPEPATGRFEMRGVKIYADGALGSRGARLYEPYSDDPGNRGLWRTEPAALARAVSTPRSPAAGRSRSTRSAMPGSAA